MKDPKRIARIQPVLSGGFLTEKLGDVTAITERGRDQLAVTVKRPIRAGAGCRDKTARLAHPMPKAPLGAIVGVR